MFKLATDACLGIGFTLVSISGCTTSASISPVSQVSPTLKESVSTVNPTPQLHPSPIMPKKEASASPKAPANTRADTPQSNFQDAETEVMFKNGQVNLNMMKSALLSSEQSKALISLTNSNVRGWKFRIVVPTYVPDGYHIKEVSIDDNGSRAAGPSYNISYRNQNNVCFSLGGFHISGAGPEAIDQTVEVSSSIFGKVTLSYTSFSQSYQGSLINFREPAPLGDLRFEVSSTSSEMVGHGCRLAPMKEIAAVVKSLKYLENRTDEKESIRSIATFPAKYRSTVFTKNYRFDFPQETCGDTRPQENFEHRSNWYPVFIDKNMASDLEHVQEYSCKDAASLRREKTKKPAILVASFISLEKATEFAEVVRGEVGKPSQ